MKKAFFILLAAIIVFTGCTKTEDETVPESVRASIRGNYYGNSGVSYVKTGIADTLYTYSTALVTNPPQQTLFLDAAQLLHKEFCRNLFKYLTSYTMPKQPMTNTFR